GLAGLAERVKFFRRVPFELSPDQLTLIARQLLTRLGYGPPPADSAWGFDHDTAYQQYLNQQDPSAGRWEGLQTGRPAMHFFWYRQSPFVLEADGHRNPFGAVTPAN